MLPDTLKVLLASSYVLSIKAQNFHWNCEGINFPQYHTFFEEYYNDVYGSIDQLAEIIRQLDVYAPGSLTRFAELSQIEDQLRIPRAELMMQELYDDTDKMHELFKAAFVVANDINEQGIANFIAERIDSFASWKWKLRSILKTQRG